MKRDIDQLLIVQTLIAISEKPNVVRRLFDILGFLVQMNTLSQAREGERQRERMRETEREI